MTRSPSSPSLAGPDLLAPACVGMGSTFLPTENELWHRAHQRAVRAVEICKTCPDLWACRQWAIENPHGCGDTGGNSMTGSIWGGTTRAERQVLRRVRRP